MSVVPRKVAVAAALVMLAGCTAISSNLASPDPNANNGLVYSLPKRMLDISVEFSESGDHKVAVQGGGYYPDPDPASRFVARIHRGKVGKIDAKIVSVGGLLTSADAKYTGQASQLAEAVGSAAGTLGGMKGGDPRALDPAACKKKLSVKHSIVVPAFDRVGGQDRAVASFNALGGGAPCAQVSVVVEQLGTHGNGRGPAPTRSDGLWYRSELPYVVRVTLGGGPTATGLILLPDQSPPFFVEMEAGLFADTDSKMVFTNGMLTSYAKSNDSEVIALLKLPAGVIAAYAKAVGEVFTNFSTAKKHEANAQVAEINRELLLRRIEACNLAITQNQPAETVATVCNIQPLP